MSGSAVPSWEGITGVSSRRLSIRQCPSLIAGLDAAAVLATNEGSNTKMAFCFSSSRIGGLISGCQTRRKEGGVPAAHKYSRLGAIFGIPDCFALLLELRADCQSAMFTDYAIGLHKMGEVV